MTAGTIDEPSNARRELRSRVDRLIGPGPPAAPFGTYVVGTEHPAASLGRYLERQVFGEVFGNSTQLLAAEYDPYEAASVFVIVVDHRRRTPAGVIRIVVPSPAGSKSLLDIGRLWHRDPDDLVTMTGLDPVSCSIWDLATLAVGRDYRRAAVQGLVSTALWQAVGVMASRSEIDLLVAIIHEPVYRLLQVRLAQAFATFDGVTAKPYLESPASVPIWTRRDLWRSRFATTDPTLYALMVDGRGLEAAVAPPDWGLASAIARAASIPPERRQAGLAPTAAMCDKAEPDPSPSIHDTSSAPIALANSHP